MNMFKNKQKKKKKKGREVFSTNAERFHNIFFLWVEYDITQETCIRFSSQTKSSTFLFSKQKLTRAESEHNEVLLTSDNFFFKLILAKNGNLKHYSPDSCICIFPLKDGNDIYPLKEKMAIFTTKVSIDIFVFFTLIARNDIYPWKRKESWKNKHLCLPTFLT